MEMMTRNKEAEKAYNAAIRLLGFRGYSRRELINKLAEKGHENEIIDNIILILEEDGYIDDMKLAVQFIEGKRDRKNYGRRVIEQKLSQKGISKDDIHLAYAQLAADEGEQNPEADAAARALAKWARNRDFDRQKAYAFLARRGYSYEDISRAIGEYKED